MKKFLLIFALLLFLPIVVYGQYGSQTATQIVCNTLTVVKEIVAAIGFGIVVILIIIAGIRYTTAGGDESKTAQARKSIQNALIGLVIVVSAYFLISLAQGLVTEVGGFQLLLDPCGDGMYGGGASCQTDWDCPLDQWCIGGRCQ